MKRVLITGGDGFIGSNLVRYWMQNHPEDLVINLDALTYAGNLENLQGISASSNYRFVHGDICDKSLVEKLFKDDGIDQVMHFAAESHVDRPKSELITFVKDCPGHDMRYAINSDKIMSELEWKPEYNFETGIRQTIGWYLDNSEWWSRIRDGSYQEYYKQQYGA